MFTTRCRNDEKNHPHDMHTARTLDILHPQFRNNRTLPLPSEQTPPTTSTLSSLSLLHHHHHHHHHHHRHSIFFFPKSTKTPPTALFPVSTLLMVMSRFIVCLGASSG
mmetsp:Transcript_16169/g.29218  ORF Transcript_16169/g.29218 Transcript_16169/m.29218 type:complete len:108 (+) Transcript_16169:569-892(+)